MKRLPPTYEQIHAAVFRCAGILVRNMPMTKDSKVHQDLGMDSLDVTEFLLQIEDDLDMRMPDDLIGDNASLGDIIERIESLMRSPKT